MMNQARLQDLFNYDPETGWFTNRYSRGRAGMGERAGSPSGHGYRKITVDYDKFYEHQLVWLYIHGKFPGEIDHINGDPSDNRIANLRLATRTQNNGNAIMGTNGIAGLQGVYLDRRGLKWFSKIQFQGKPIWVGTFDTVEEAHQAYLVKHRELFGEFSVHARNTLGD